ncbi:MAG: hypothetical protein AAFP03_14050 [Cyanobacteria bacterium J06598_3]
MLRLYGMLIYGWYVIWTNTPYLQEHPKGHPKKQQSISVFKSLFGVSYLHQFHLI